MLEVLNIGFIYNFVYYGLLWCDVFLLCSCSCNAPALPLIRYRNAPKRSETLCFVMFRFAMIRFALKLSVLFFQDLLTSVKI